MEEQYVYYRKVMETQQMLREIRHDLKNRLVVEAVAGAKPESERKSEIYVEKRKNTWLEHGCTMYTGDIQGGTKNETEEKIRNDISIILSDIHDSGSGIRCIKERRFTDRSAEPGVKQQIRAQFCKDYR